MKLKLPKSLIVGLAIGLALLAVGLTLLMMKG